MNAEIWGSLVVFGGISLGVSAGMPVVPLYMAAGALWGIGGLPIVLLALAFHFLICYFLTRSFLRPRLEKFFKKFESKIQMPNLKGVGPIKLILLVRMIPGLPLVAASYGLALVDMPVTTYVLTSLFVQIFWASAFMLFGSSIVKNNYITLSCALVVLLILFIISRNYARRKKTRENL